MLQQQSRVFWIYEWKYEWFIKYCFIIIVAKFTPLVTRFSSFLLWGYGFLHQKIIFSSTEIISGVIKSVKKDGEWKVTVDTKEEILLIFVALNLLPLCGNMPFFRFLLWITWPQEFCPLAARCLTFWQKGWPVSMDIIHSF